MGERGPPPLPAQIHQLRGTWRADRHADAEPQTWTREAPPDLDAYGLERWNDLVPLLTAQRVLGDLDYGALWLHCATWSWARRCEEVVRTKGCSYVIETEENGDHEKQRPEAANLKHLLPILAQQLREFGLTPASRSSAVKGAAPTQTPKEKDKGRFFGGGGG